MNGVPSGRLRIPPSPLTAGSTSSANTTPVSAASIDRPSNELLVCDATYYGVAPDVTNVLKQANYNGDPVSDTSTLANAAWQADEAFVSAQAARYNWYWENVGNATFMNYGGANASGVSSNLYSPPTGPASYGSLATDWQTTLGRHEGQDDVLFADGHVKAINGVSLVENLCYWVTNGGISTVSSSNVSTPNYTNHPCN
jgi:prepilin-type processing-associated H-X9-DG protein